MLAVQAVALLGFCGFYLYEVGVGATDDPVRAVMSIVIMLVVAFGLVGLAKGWLADGDWPRTPTLVWNALLIPVAWGLLQGGRTGIGVLLGIVAVVAIAAAVAARPAGEDAELEDRARPEG